ncbi:YSIRK-type signal peptide-containing protein [Streptococcus suis]|uniref:YSIRK-type signal peptide-containing protein n=1 Tax=Streptococcus suis TaxID=1307 RepID=UPI002119629A|nr:YSIRK-type signal peptide-containing protein [Streptococcus suis]
MKRKNSSMFVNKQLFSIRKVHFGAASVIIGALIAFGSGNVVNANTLDGAVVENSSNSAQASEVVVENNATEVTGLIADTNSAENDTSLASAESIDLTSTEVKTTNYVVDAKITLSDEYISALEDRNSIMNELKGQKEVDGVLVFNQPKKAAGYKEDAENLQLLENLGKEHLVSNTYAASVEDNSRVVDPLNLSESEFEELNVFSADIANQIRQQIIDKQTRNNQTVTVEKAYVPVGMQDLAFEVTNKAHAIDKERGLSVIVAGDTGGYHGYEYFPWGDKSSGTPERTGIIREAIENNKLDSSQLDLHPEWGQRPASTFTITTINSTSSSHYDNRISLVGMTMGRLKELIYEGYRTGLFTLASETRPERKWEHALNLTSLETRRLPQYQPNTMISSGLYFIQNRDTWAVNPATGKKEDTKKPVSLTNQYFVNFNFYQDSYSPVIENRINHGESAPGYVDGFDTTLILNVNPEDTTEEPIGETSGEPTGETSGEPTGESSGEPTGESSGEPTGESSGEPTGESSGEPTGESSGEPTGESSGEPTGESSGEPTGETSGEPTGESSGEPTGETSGEPTGETSGEPTGETSGEPTGETSGEPTGETSGEPTGETSGEPTGESSGEPTGESSGEPTGESSGEPTGESSGEPTGESSGEPTGESSGEPTGESSGEPTGETSGEPTGESSGEPTGESSGEPTGESSGEPTGESSGEPTGESSGEPTGESSGEPTGESSGEPTGESSGEPTGETSGEPTGETSGEPTGETTGEPTGETTGEPTGESSGESTGESSGEPTPPTPEEPKPEVKPEVKTVVNTIGNIPSGSSVSNNSAKTLPQTGEDTSFASILGVSLLSSALFIAKRRRDV